MFVRGLFPIQLPSYDSPDELGQLDSLDSDVKLLESDEKADDDSGKEDDKEDEVKDDKKEDEVEDEESSDEDEEKEDEGDEEEEESKEEDEEEEEPKVALDGKISVKALKEAYPDIFKKNPSLKDIIFREREYSKVFGSVDDAREAQEKSDTLDKFEESLMVGDIGSLLDVVADADQDAALKIAEQFLPALYERSKPVFQKVTLPIVKGVIRNTFTRAQNKGDKQLALACQYLSKEFFDSPDVLKVTQFEEEEEDPRRAEIEAEKRGLQEEKASNANNDILGVVVKSLNKDILSRLDAKMSDFVKEALSEKIISELNRTLSSDKGHMMHLSSLWKKMQRNGYTAEAKSKIISASLARAKAVLPSVIAKVKAAQGKKVEAKGKADKTVPNQTRSKTSGNRPPAKLGRGVSDFEFLSQP